MKAKKLLALLLTGAMAAALGTFAIACNKGNNPDAGGTGGGGGGGTTADYTLDETEYYLAGNGAGDLKQNGWSETNPCLPLVRDEDADHNVFTITIDMYARDEFKIVHDNSYTGEIGFSAVTPYEVLEGGYSNGDANAKGPVSKNADGEVVFYEGGGFGGNITLELGHDGTYKFSLHTYPDGEADTKITWEKLGDLKPQSDMYLVGSFNDFGFDEQVFKTNHMTASGEIWRGTVEITAADCKYDATGAAGTEYAMLGVRNEVPDDNNIKQVYIDTSDAYKTGINENDEYNLVPAGVYTVTYNGADNSVTIKAGAHDIYFIGSMNEWATDMGDEWKLTENPTTGIWGGNITVTKDEELKLYNKLGGNYYPDGMDNNIKISAGDWAFTYNPETDEVKYEKLGYFVLGTFVDGDNHIQNFVIVKDLTPAMTEDDGKYSATLNVTDVSGVVDGDSNYGWLASEGGNAIFAIKVVYGSALLGARDWYGIGDKGDANYFFHEAGEYTVTFDAETHEIAVAPVVHEVTVTFHINDNDATGEPQPVKVTAGETITAPTPEPTCDTHNFYGWYTEAECENKFDFNTPITEDTELYGRWIAKTEVVEGKKVTFTYHDDATENVVETVDEKGLVAEKTPSRDGYYFLGWFTEESAGDPFNFNDIVKDDVTVHAHWLKKVEVEYSLAGAKNGWSVGDTTYNFVHDPANPNSNRFVLKINLKEGQDFKIVHSHSWDNELTTTINGVDTDETVRFTGGGGSNIEVKVDGYYSFVLEITNPDNPRAGTLTWTWSELIIENELHIKADGNKDIPLVKTPDGWKGEISLNGTETFTIVDVGDDNKLCYTNEVAFEEGDYSILYDMDKNELKYEKLEFYLVGSFTDENGKADDSYNFKLSAKAAKKLTKGDGNIYTIDLEVKDVSAEYTWVKPGVFAIKIVYGTILGGIKDWHGVGEDFTNQYADKSSDGNILPKTVGTYTITIDASSFEITITKTA